MTEPTPTLVVRFDDDIASWLIGQTPMGPGGAVSIELPGGITLAVDAADPRRIVELVVPAEDWDPERRPSRAALAATAALVGTAAADLIATNGGAPVRNEVPLDPATATQRRIVGGLALLDDLRAEISSGWWAADACLLCALADPAFGLTDRGRREARAGAHAMIDADAVSILAPLPMPRVTRVASAVAASLDAEDDGIATRVREATSVLRRKRSQPLTPEEVEQRFLVLFEEGIVAAPGPVPVGTKFRAPPSGLVEGLFAIGRSLIDQGRLKPGLVAIPSIGRVAWNKRRRALRTVLKGGGEWELQPSEMLVRLLVHPDATDESLSTVWVRIFTLSPRGLVVTAPLVRHVTRTLGVARFAVPTHFELPELAVDVTDEPASQPDGDQTVAVRTAIGFARAAGGSERLQRWSGACGAWERCAKAWADAGDEHRMAVALLYAADSAERIGLDDRAETYRHTAGAAGVGPLAGPDPDREIPDPFLAEAVVPDTWVL